MESIGSKIRRLRSKKGMTQQELADKIGVSFTTVSLYESDSRKPSFKALSRIAQVFDVTPAFFFESNDENGDIKKEKIRFAARNMERLSEEEVETINKLIKSMIKHAKEGN